ncbi:hypothetical protein [Robbsia sp. KACC 23696]|uniref:hypothetical protein n=1 Tax=Robbsia sp. KACC 23696 TaxID=3149231 RepID=UPI00325B0B4F
MMAQEQKAAPDWERIEADYRAGLLSVREIAASQGVSHVAIAKRAKRDGWTRDLGAKIRAKAESLVTSSVVTTPVTTPQAVTDKQIIADNALAMANVLLTQRKDVGRARRLAMQLLEEVETLTGKQELLGQLEEILRGEDESSPDRRREVYGKVLSVPSRIDSMKKLAETLRILVTLEREVFGMVDPGDGPPPPPPPNPAQFIQNTTVVIQDAVAATVRKLELDY